MKRVTIVGIGMGPDTVTQEGLEAIQKADILLGAPRMLHAFSYLGKKSYPEYTPKGVCHIVDTSEAALFAVLVSGDTGFFSAAEDLCMALANCEVSLIPGISSLNYFFAKLKRPWQDAALLSCHGRSTNLVDMVRRNRLTFALTGGNLIELAQTLADAGFGGLAAHVGENLSMETERLLTCPVAEIQALGADALCVLLIENPNCDSRVRLGIPDEEFIRGNVPMTKAEVRAVSLSKLGLSPNSVCCDIGAGTGSVAVEMALAAYRGHVYAVEQNEAATALIRQNCRKFHLSNVTAIPRGAPEALDNLPTLDAAFIGGSSGHLKGIVSALIKNNPSMRIVINAIALETLHAALEALDVHGIPAEVVQLGISKAESAGRLHMMKAQNPIFVISGGNYAR